MNIWVVVADTRRVRIFETDRFFSKLDEVHDLLNPRAQLELDARGRGREGPMGPRHGIEPKESPHEAELKALTQQLSQFLYQSFNAHRFDNMVLIAGPELLGCLRKTLDPQVQLKIARSINKDLSRCSTEELSDHLKAA